MVTSIGKLKTFLILSVNTHCSSSLLDSRAARTASSATAIHDDRRRFLKEGGNSSCDPGTRPFAFGPLSSAEGCRLLRRSSSGESMSSV